MYELTWITDHLATGYAPMSYAELDSIREQGITAIVNLCGEFCDLHEIEENSGFEVYYLPVPDESAPDLASLEKALAWMDEAIYLHKKVLVHCRYGHGRTGTFVSAYMLRRGLPLRLTEKKLKGKRANPTNYSQWKLLKKYGKQEGRLRVTEPSIDNRPRGELTPLLDDYLALTAAVDRQLSGSPQKAMCGQGDHTCCYRPFTLTLIESIYLSHVVNKTLSREARNSAIQRALTPAIRPEADRLTAGAAGKLSFPCPLLGSQGECLVFPKRPIRCRSWDAAGLFAGQGDVQAALQKLSENVYLSLAGSFPPQQLLNFSVADTVSGKFVQGYFQAVMEGGEN